MAGHRRLPRQPHAPRREVPAHQPGLRRQAAPHAVLQPAEQRRPHPRHPVGRRGAWPQRLPQEQVKGERPGVRGGPARAPHRWHRRLRYPLHRLREVPTARFIPNCDWWGEIMQ